jgi:adenine-specific DNA-methyltransferase
MDSLITNDPPYLQTAEGNTKEERVFNVALELCITWMNRILFLKLMEGQLVNYHQGNQEYKFLNSEKVFDYDELFKLFHQVLALKINDRKEAVKEKYSKVPYLNSSLFDISPLEQQTIKINALDNSLELDLINTSILKESKKTTSKLPTLNYLFQFLDAYDFASEGTDDIKEDKKELINASVLGKIFEKINGYKDGSIFTPAFITMYMCKQSIRLAVVEKFNEALSSQSTSLRGTKQSNEEAEKLFETFDDLKNYTTRQHKTTEVLKANEIVNSLRICDPAVGSGHFLVSALNEIISIKADLGILADEKGNTINNYEIEIINDELIITEPNNNDQQFEYNIQNCKPKTKEIQRLQKTLFHEKETIIENCLFGVDINPNSVKICSLRLWIELLKNAYYKEDTNYLELETLPNIDINIKCGNSLLSRFTLNEDLSNTLKSIKYTFDDYKGFVTDYKNATDKEEKQGLLKIIADIKDTISSQFFQNSKENKSLARTRGEYQSLMFNRVDLFGNKVKGKTFELQKQRLRD